MVGVIVELPGTLMGLSPLPSTENNTVAMKTTIDIGHPAFDASGKET